MLFFIYHISTVIRKSGKNKLQNRYNKKNNVTHNFVCKCISLLLEHADTDHDRLLYQCR